MSLEEFIEIYVNASEEKKKVIRAIVAYFVEQTSCQEED